MTFRNAMKCNVWKLIENYPKVISDNNIAFNFTLWTILHCMLFSKRFRFLASFLVLSIFLQFVGFRVLIYVWVERGMNDGFGIILLLYVYFLREAERTMCFSVHCAHYA